MRAHIQILIGISVAAMLEVVDGICRDACMVLGAVAPTPYRAVAA